MKHVLLMLLVATLLLGCSGSMNGTLRGDGERITANYQQDFGYDTLTVLMPDGATFTGKVIMQEKSSRNKSGVLFGDNGRTMRCRLNYVDPYGFIHSGGGGVCTTSSNQIIDIQW